MLSINFHNIITKIKKSAKLQNLTDKTNSQLFQNNSDKSYDETKTYIERDTVDNLEYCIDYQNWKISISDLSTHEEVGIMKYRTKNKSLHIDMIISYRAWTWTKLIQKLVEISYSIWKNWLITATANPFVISSRPSYRRENTNLKFYYKLWFRAVDDQIHQQIMWYLDEWVDIPISLNINTDLIYIPK